MLDFFKKHNLSVDDIQLKEIMKYMEYRGMLNFEKYVYKVYGD